ncbi:MAG: hypothetical protein ACK559_30735, partial [bacterium]
NIPWKVDREIDPAAHPAYMVRNHLEDDFPGRRRTNLCHAARFEIGQHLLGTIPSEGKIQHIGPWRTGRDLVWQRLIVLHPNAIREGTAHKDNRRVPRPPLGAGHHSQAEFVDRIHRIDEQSISDAQGMADSLVGKRRQPQQF